MKKNKVKVLIVDDDLTIASSIESYLFVKDIDTLSVNSVYEAIQILKQQSFDVILSDVNMPDINGFEFLLWLKKNKIQSHIIIMTAQSNEKSKEVYHNYGVLKYISKPIDMSQLLATINQTAKSGFSGDIKETNLFDYIQIMALSKRNRVLSITSSLIELPAYLYFKEGELISAEYGQEKGEEAFFKIIKITGGNIAEIQKEFPQEINIKVPATSLLFKATQLIDEENFKNNKSNSRYSVLVVDDETLTRMIIEKSLSKDESLEIFTVESAGEAALVLKDRYFDLVISDINMPDINGLEFLLWMKKNGINSKVVMMTAAGSMDIKNFAINSGAIRYLEKPLDFDELKKIIEQDKSSGFSGNINEIGIFDYVQMISLSRKTKAISVTSPLTYSEGMIYFKTGNIVHAEYENLSGVDAFFKLVTISGGIISEVEDKMPSEETIKLSIPSLLMKATGYLEKENTKKTNINIDEKIIESIDKKLNNLSVQDSKTVISIKTFPVNNIPPAPINKSNLPLNNSINKESSAEKNLFNLINVRKKQTGKLSLEESPYLKKLESFKYIIPQLSSIGEKATKDVNTPMSIYQMLKKVDGTANLDFIYKESYYHLNISDFFDKFEKVKTYISVNPFDLESLKINVFQVLLYNKDINSLKLRESIDIYLSSSDHTDKDRAFISGNFLIELNLLDFVQITNANIFVNKFNKFIINFS